MYAPHVFCSGVFLRAVRVLCGKDSLSKNPARPTRLRLSACSSFRLRSPLCSLCALCVRKSLICTTITKIHAFLTRSYACNSRTCSQGGRFYHRHSITFPAARKLRDIYQRLHGQVPSESSFK